MNNFEDGCIVPNGVKFANVDYDTFFQFKLQKGDILFNRTNSYDLVGKVGIFLLDGDYTFASYLIRLTVDTKRANHFFVNFLLNTPSFQSKLRALATRGSSQCNINATNLKSLLVPVPPLKEQERIASLLSSINSRKDAEKRVKEMLENLKKGLMQVLLTGKVRVKMN